ncbi:MAG: translation initiation factor IF-2 [Chloroflexota bacterium]|nr:translation initiation factor IF-2 [Chloroflexota bacterium]
MSNRNNGDSTGRRDGTTTTVGGGRRGGSGGRRGGGPQRGGGNNRGGAPGRGGVNDGRGPRGGQVGAGRTSAVTVRTRRIIELPPIMTVKDLADSFGISPPQVIGSLIRNGVMATINQQIDYETAEIIASDLGYQTRLVIPQTDEERLVAQLEEQQQPQRDGAAALQPRPPVVTVMGHVDHGKTRLLDAIRRTNVVEGEAGGITQHIGAYQVEVQGRKITFLDTPGHEAFTAMRARGAQVTDIVVLVVAADDGVMPQTLEALAHARAAEVPIVVAVNKIDREGANPDRVKQQLSDQGLVPDDWGGDTPFINVSALTRTGINDLLGIILLVADMRELTANPNRPAEGVIIEARVDPNQGPTATVLVHNGTLKLRDSVLAGAMLGRVRAMYDDKGQKLRKAEPSTPVRIQGLEGVPQAGDQLMVVADERLAREVADQRARTAQMATTTLARPKTLDELFKGAAANKAKELRVVLKADVQGSIGAIQHALGQITDEGVNVSVVYSGTGTISESDVRLAAASDAIIIGFNVRPDPAARRVAESENVDIRFYNIIYNLVDDVRAALSGMLDPEYREVIDGYAEVRQVFRLPGREQAAGSYMLDGRGLRNDRVRVLRGGAVIHDGTIASLKRFKDDVREVATGFEFGLQLTNFSEFEEGDNMEFYHQEQVRR